MGQTRREAIVAFNKAGGMLRTSEAIRVGIHPRTLYQMRDDGTIVQVSRGLFRLAELPGLTEPDLVTISARAPRATVCLISALAFHDITEEIPHEVHIALPRGTQAPRIEHPPIRVYRFSGRSLTAGVETHELDGVRVRMYKPEKTVADCFKFRNKIGTDVAVSALKLCLERKRSQPRTLLYYARICRIDRVMIPYLEALA